jgi:two-component sensor histidine kinase
VHKQRLVTATALIIGLGVTAVAGWTSHRYLERVSNQQNALRAENAASAVQLALDRVALAVRAVRAMYAADWVTRDQFVRFARSLTTNESIRSLGFYRRIESDDRAAYEAGLTTEPGRTIGIWEYDKDQKPVRAPERPVYYVIESGFVRAGTEPSYALNIASLPGRGDSLVQASSAFDVVVSDRISFTNAESGLAFYGSTIDRSGEIAGVAAATVTFAELADVARRASGVAGINVDLGIAPADGSAPRSPPNARSFAFGGKTWVVAVPANAASIADRWLTLLVIGVGLAATGTVVAYLFGLAKRREVAEAQARLTSMLDGLGPLVWLLELDGTVVHANRTASSALGKTEREITGRRFWELPLGSNDPEAPALVRSAVEKSARGSEARFDLAVTRAGNDNDQVIDLWIRPLAGEAGRPVGLVVSAVDVTDRFEGEQTQRLLMRELDHRMKNTLQVVQAVIRRTARTQRSIPQFETALLGRVGAMSRAHDLLAQERWIGADIATVVRQEAAIFDAGSAIRLGGPPVRLNPRAALSIALAIHELGTNAAKYGALSVSAGMASAGWSIDRDASEPCLVLRWEESGGPPVAAPQARGFGSMLIERSIAYELDGKATIDYREAGLTCTIAIPLRTIRPFVAERTAQSAT